MGRMSFTQELKELGKAGERMDALAGDVGPSPPSVLCRRAPREWSP